MIFSERITQKKTKRDIYSVTALALLLSIGGSAVQSAQAAEPSSIASTSVTQNVGSQPFSLAALVSTGISAGTQYQTTIWLNLRSGPGTNYGIIGSGVTGTTVTATGNTNGIWYEVKMGAQTGWMSSDYLKQISSPTTSSGASGQYQTTIWLNLRSGPGTNYGIIGSGVTGTTVTATGKTSGIWYEVKLGAQTGWMSSEYLSKVAAAAPAPAPAPAPAASPTIAVSDYKTTIQLNFRSGPGTNYSILGSGVAGTTVTATGKTSGIWYEVKMNGQTGWMSSEYLTKVVAPAPAPVVTTPVVTAPTVDAVQYKTTIQLNLRSGPGTTYSILGSGVIGTTVTGTGKTSGTPATGLWYEVKMGSQTGWMSSTYLQAVTGPNTVAALQAYAGSKLNNDAQLKCLVTLWDKESGWNYQALNSAFSPSQPSTPSYQAYGIAQAAPGNRMATAGADWETNPRTQINWGLGYISERYGNPCSALTYWSLRGWY